jgi:hypothetical protein
MYMDSDKSELIVSMNPSLIILRRLLRSAAEAGYLDRDQAVEAAGVGNTRSLGVRQGTG